MVTVTSLNAVDYGMVPNTSADQTANFQSAINAAQSQLLPLYIPAGTYLITTVNVSSNVEIYSSSRSGFLQGYGGQSPQINIAPISPATYVDVVHIRDISIDGGGQSFSGTPSDAGLIQASNTFNLIIDDCYINASAIHGVYLNAAAGKVTNNLIGAAGSAGIFSIDAATSGMTIENNSVLDSGNNGILVWRSSVSGDNSQIIRNTIGNTGAALGGTGQYGNAINIFKANFVIVESNSIYGSTFSAIRLNSSSFCQILGNNSFGSGENAIWLECPGSTDGFAGGVVANNIIDTTGGGIFVANTTDGGHRVVVSNNQVSNVVVQTVITGYQSIGRAMQGEGDVLFTGNQIDGAEDWGITLIPFALGTTKTVGQAENNMIKNCAGGIGFVKDNTGTGIFIGGNTIYKYTTTTKYAAIVACSYNGSTGAVSKLSGATDLGNATSSGFSNVKLLLNYSFT
jgi:uncharacterized secreted repeat protein (TIGR03808 family)